MKAQEIKKAIVAKMTEKKKPVKSVTILNIEGFLYEVGCGQWEEWRALKNAVITEGKDAGKPDMSIRKMAPGKLIQLSFRDEDGELVFEHADVPMLSNIPTRQIETVCRDIMQINGFDDDSIEILLKNLILITGVDGLYDILAKLGFPCPKCSKDTLPVNSEPNGQSNTTGPQARQPKIGGQG